MNLAWRPIYRVPDCSDLSGALALPNGGKKAFNHTSTECVTPEKGFFVVAQICHRRLAKREAGGLRRLSVRKSTLRTDRAIERDRSVIVAKKRLRRAVRERNLLVCLRNLLADRWKTPSTIGTIAECLALGFRGRA